ncbi:DUF6879 family protein [Nocardia testacea]|uniref:DUF6879 family protein n=1 Tax=Nocardia testacea TaxID=248551 RepID=UPI003A859301
MVVRQSDGWIQPGDRDGRPAGAAVTKDPGIAAHCRSIRDRLWEMATPYAEYVSR